jgi:uncharacterized membrane protein
MAENTSRRLAESTRVEAFSDGVFAVAITLLVLDLRAPEGKGEFLSELLAQWQSYVAYLAAFLVIGVVWLTHHSLFTRIARVNTRLMLQNLLHLLLTSLVPFAALVISNSMRDGDLHDQTVGVVLFSIVSVLLSLSWYWLCRYLEGVPYLLVDDTELPALVAARRRQLVAVIPAVLAAVIALFSPIWGLVLLGVLPLFYIGTVLRSERSAR